MDFLFQSFGYYRSGILCLVVSVGLLMINVFGIVSVMAAEPPLSVSITCGIYRYIHLYFYSL